MDYETLKDQVNGIVQEQVDEGTYIEYLPELDRRAGRGFYLCQDYLVTSMTNARNLDYYGGFEYIPQEYRVQIGDWLLFSLEHGRVISALGSLYPD